MQVLRQKSIEVLNLDVVAQESQSFGRPVTTPKPLLGRISMERLLSSRLRPTTSHASRSGKLIPLFGTEILDTLENRAVIFRRFTDLWSLIAQSSESEPSDVVVRPSDVHTRPLFECNMAMAKICKTVGISLTPSAPTRFLFWCTNEQGVDFESFCNFAIQGAIQPALHHFNLDNSVAEYVSALDTILQSLVTAGSSRYNKDKTAFPSCDRRMKELDEIQPLFVSWKAGISPRLTQSEVPAATPLKARVTAEKVRRALEASVSQHMLANQLPTEEARVAHVENIRRKVRLHKSWNTIDKRGISTKVSHNENEEVLVCCSCSVREAVLWCSSCFSVNCQKCWQEVHLCSVDLSMVSSQSRNLLVGPTAMAKKRSGNTTLAPPVPMIYLPTKTMVSGTLAKGNSNSKRNTSNQLISSTKDEIPVVLANAILPSLHKSQSDTTVLRYQERHHLANTPTPATDSTTELVKSLMLRMSPATTTRTGGQSTMDPTLRQYKHHTSVRPKLHLSPVSLDAEFLLSKNH
ncbi:Hypothetical protein PHPALM_1242 [Phytophthora palmivora]|uniref:B box-type domain-containing protein n=1 Tax=Phytophthora palmivora TaxID=4796 RepID=A0A2P4YSU7_9STRA|nr:Hypothetical protein PHPALM_1242 [Phytophthora palmivora]